MKHLIGVRNGAQSQNSIIKPAGPIQLTFVDQESDFGVSKTYRFIASVTLEEWETVFPTPLASPVPEYVARKLEPKEVSHIKLDGSVCFRPVNAVGMKTNRGWCRTTCPDGPGQFPSGNLPNKLAINAFTGEDPLTFTCLVLDPAIKTRVQVLGDKQGSADPSFSKNLLMPVNAGKFVWPNGAINSPDPLASNCTTGIDTAGSCVVSVS